MDKAYVEAVRLMLEVAPVVFRAPGFALKGGTGINLFVQDMPRLSVDIDVVYDDLKKGRDEALTEIATELTSIKTELGRQGIDAAFARTKVGDEVKLLVQRQRIQVKVEVNFVFRGTLLPTETRRLVDSARDLFTTSISLPVLAEPELYGSKLVAALDRQHPRDWFDVWGMYQQPGLTDEIVECFVCYLAGHNRPVHEVLFSRDIDLTLAFENEFQGMTTQSIALDELVAARKRLRADLAGSLSEKQRAFLLSLVRAEPNWKLMSCSHLSEMPALRWKLRNLDKLRASNVAKFREQAEELERRFNQ